MRDETQLIATIYLRVTLIFASCKLYSEGGHEHGGQEECGANWAKTLSEAISVDSISVDPSPEKSVDEIPLHACDIEQAFLQADKLPEGVNGRYFIQPPPGSPDANNRDVVYEVCRPLPTSSGRGW